MKTLVFHCNFWWNPCLLSVQMQKTSEMTSRRIPPSQQPIRAKAKAGSSKSQSTIPFHKSKEENNTVRFPSALKWKGKERPCLKWREDKTVKEKARLRSLQGRLNHCTKRGIHDLQTDCTFSFSVSWQFLPKLSSDIASFLDQMPCGQHEFGNPILHPRFFLRLWETKTLTGQKNPVVRFHQWLSPGDFLCRCPGPFSSTAGQTSTNRWHHFPVIMAAGEDMELVAETDNQR